MLSRRGLPAGQRREPSAVRGADADDVAGSLSLHRSADRGSGGAEQVGEFSGAVLAAFEQGRKVRFLPMFSLAACHADALWPWRPSSPLGCATESGRTGLCDHREHLNSGPPTGPVGSYPDPPRLIRTCRTVSSSAMALASGGDRASRSSLVPTNVSPSRHAARASRRPGRSRFVPRTMTVRPASTPRRAADLSDCMQIPTNLHGQSGRPLRYQPAAQSAARTDSWICRR